VESDKRVALSHFNQTCYDSVYEYHTLLPFGLRLYSRIKMDFVLSDHRQNEDFRLHVSPPPGSGHCGPHLVPFVHSTYLRLFLFYFPVSGWKSWITSNKRSAKVTQSSALVNAAVPSGRLPQEIILGVFRYCRLEVLRNANRSCLHAVARDDSNESNTMHTVITNFFSYSHSIICLRLMASPTDQTVKTVSVTILPP